MDGNNLDENSHLTTPIRHKRKRKIISCLECRRNKLKCDHSHPCGRCEKNGIGDTCTYVDQRPKSPIVEATPESIARTEPAYIITAADNMTMHMRMQTYQIEQLERRLAELENGKSVARTPSGQEETHEREVETRIFRGKSFKTQFYGATHPGSIIVHFPELGTFMKEAIGHHSHLKRVRDGLKVFKPKQNDPSIIPAAINHLDLVSLLPPRDVCRPLLELYFGTIEKTFRIIHEPTFWAEFERYSTDFALTPCGFIATQLLMMACVKCMSTEPMRYVGSSSIARETAISWIQASESWYNFLSRKHVTIVNYQVRCLLLVAKRLNSIKEKQVWGWSCDLVRFGMSAGLHREPSLLRGKISPFEQEMRRRLWATMVELELQMCLERGMPSSLNGISMDTRAPANVDDSGFEDSFSQQDPVSHPWREYTSASYLHVSHRSVPLRIALSAVLNNTTPLSFDEVRYHEQKIVHELNTLPQWAHSESPRERHSEVAAVLLDVQLRQYLILLHAPLARQAGYDPQYSYSRSVCLESSRMILQNYIRLGQSANHFLSMLRYDIFQASLSMCHNLFLSTNIHLELCFAMIAKVLTILDDQLLRLGKSFKHYWLISATWGLVKSKFEPHEAEAETAKKEAIDRVMNLYYKILTLQESQGVETSGCLAVQDSIPFVADYTDPFGWVLDDVWGFDGEVDCA